MNDNRMRKARMDLHDGHDPLPAANLKLCCIKNCTNHGTHLPLITVYCKGKKGRGKNGKKASATMPLPFCESHIPVARIEDLKRHINWNALTAQFNALHLPGPKQSTAFLRWVDAEE